MPLTFLAERFSIRVKAAKNSQQFLFLHSQPSPPATQRLGVWSLHGPKAAVAPAVVRGANRSATSMSHRAKAGCTLRHHHANRPSPFAFDTNAMRGRIRLPFVQECTYHFNELVLVDRTAAQFEINVHVIRNRRGLVQSIDICRSGVNN